MVSCYAAKFDNHDLLELCGAGILPARIIQTKCTTAYQENPVHDSNRIATY